ncbi:type IX secretion system membrane protein PorP/SprF [bacterium]|nr:type IX secretion system membrane protein PorP/SprF [bacterium]
MDNTPKTVTVVIILVLIFVFSFNDLRAFVYENPKGSAFQTFINPAQLSCLKQNLIVLDYYKFYWGIGDNIQKGGLRYGHIFENSGLGLSALSFFSPMYSQQEFWLAYGKRLTKPASIQEEMERIGLFGGVNLNIINRRFREENFQLGEPDPLFDEYGYSKWGLGLGLGLVYNMRRSYLGLFLKDLNQPNLALEDGVKDPLPLQAGLEAGISPMYNLNFRGTIIYANEDLDLTDRINTILNVDYWILENKFNLNAEVNLYTLSLGFNYRFEPSMGFEFGYNFFYPYSNLSTTHHVYLNFRFKPPPPLYPDLLIKEPLYLSEGYPIIGAGTTVTCLIENQGRRPAKGFWVSAVTDNKSLKPQKVDKIEPGESFPVSFSWVPEIAGKHQFTARADDDARNLPSFKDDILEINEDNNQVSSQIEILPPPEFDCNVQNNILKVKQITSIVEDEPIVPIVFFQVDDTLIDNRFNKVIYLVSKRMLFNPDIDIVLEGYWNPGSECLASPSSGKELAIARANAVKNKIIAMEPSTEKRIIVRDSGYDFTETRAQKEQFQGTTKGPVLIAEENRRVEISAQLRNNNIFTFDPVDIQNNAPSIRAELDEINTVCRDNKDLYLIISVEGDPRRSTGLLLSKADSLRRLFIENYHVLTRDRVFIHSRETADPELRVKFILSPAAITYKPNRKQQVFDDYVIDPAHKAARIIPEVRSQAGVEVLQCIILNSEQDTIASVFNESRIPAEIIWEWKNDLGQLVDPEDYYLAKLQYADTMGQKAECLTGSLWVELTNEEQISERLILVQFAFAGKESEAGYAEARLEYIARRMIDRIEGQEGLDIVIGGHTDNVGVRRSNYRLSEERAESQMVNLRKYMMVLLGLNSQSELDHWLNDKKVKLITRGFGDSQPYTITREEEAKTERILVGDNAHPEGRIINRRVEVNFIGK